MALGLLVLGLATYFAFFVRAPDSEPSDGPIPQDAIKAAEVWGDGAAVVDNQGITVEGELTPCVPIEDFVAGPDGYRLDLWFMSWGAPPIGNTSDPASAFSWYDDQTLLEMDRTGDAVAKHERGRRMVVSALTGVDKLPAESSVWDIAKDSKELPLDAEFDHRKLEEGREILFEAAVLGRTYALIEIAISYALERRARLTSGESDPAFLAELRMKSFAFGESAERLVPALHSGFFQSSLPDELRPRANRELEEISERVTMERQRRGTAVSPIDEETSRLFESLRICRE